LPGSIGGSNDAQTAAGQSLLELSLVELSLVELSLLGRMSGDPITGPDLRSA